MTIRIGEYGVSSSLDMPVEIRVAEAGDAGLLAEVGRATFLDAFERRIEHSNLIAFANKRFGLQEQTAELCEPGTMFFIAWCGREAAGYAKLCERVPPLCVAEGCRVELERLYLYGKWHGLGVANALMDVCLAEALRQDYAGIWLDVWDQNARAQAFYRKYLFNLVGERAYIVGTETQRHLLMSRELGSADAVV